MQAPDLATLLNFGANFRAGFVAIGQKAGVPIIADTASDTRKAPYVEFHFVLGAPSGHRRVVPGRDPRTHLHDAFGGEFIFGAVTNREVTTVPNEDVCAAVRAMMATIFAQPADVFPFYQLNMVKPMQNSLLSDTGKRLDLTRIPYAIHFSIRPEAWPTGY